LLLLRDASSFCELADGPCRHRDRSKSIDNTIVQ
jgi:hypothetical protein